MPRKFKKINSRIVYKNPWIKVREDAVVRPDGKRGIYGFLEKAAGNFIIAIDNHNFIYLINEYRYPVKKIILQLPAGVIDSKNIVHEAKKELYEETGIVASRWKKIGGFYVAPGHETTYINVFVAEKLDLSKLKVSNQEGNEGIIKITRTSLPKLKKIVLQGKIKCGITLAALNLFFLKYASKQFLD